MTTRDDELTYDALDALLSRCVIPTDVSRSTEREARVQFSYRVVPVIPRLVAEVKRSRAERTNMARELDEAHASEVASRERAERAEAEIERLKSDSIVIDPQTAAAFADVLDVMIHRLDASSVPPVGMPMLMELRAILRGAPSR